MTAVILVTGLGAYGAVNNASATSATCASSGAGHFSNAHPSISLIWCHTWATAPIYAQPGTPGQSTNPSAVIDHMYKGRDYYACYVVGAENPVTGQWGQFKNNVWLYTVGDVTGQTGWQPATYVSEGNSYEVPGNVPSCDVALKAPAAVPAVTPAPPAAAASSLPDGVFDGGVYLSGVLHVYGWAFDPDTPTSAVAVFINYDNTFGQTRMQTGVSRPDVQAAFPQTTANQGFDITIPVDLTGNRACIALKDTSSDAVRTLGCLSGPGTSKSAVS